MSKDNNREAQPESDLPEQGEAFAQRRQVIRGMASIPVALTLSSGAALANTSSHACLSNESGVVPSPSCSDTSPVPGWATSGTTKTPATIDGITYPASDFPAKYCVAYAEENMPPNGQYVVTGYRYEHNGNSIFINENGTLSNSTNGNPLRASCATSFANP